MSISQGNARVTGLIEGSKWQNSYKITDYGLEECLRRYRDKIVKGIDEHGVKNTLRHDLHELIRMTLGCWCDTSCHGHVLKELIQLKTRGNKPSTGEQASGSALVSVQHSDWSSSECGDPCAFLQENNVTPEDEARILYEAGIIDSETFSEMVPGIEHGSIPGATDHQILPVHARAIRVGTDCSGIEAPIQALRNLQVNFEHSFSCDNDKNVKKAILANFSPKTFYDDVTTRNNATAESTDLYIAGFLCQPFSNAGLRKGFSDNRGEIFFHLANYIRQKLPKVRHWRHYTADSISKQSSKN